MKKTLWIIASVIVAGGLLLLLLGTAVGVVGVKAWRNAHPAPLADLSDTALPLTFKTRSPLLQAKLKDIAVRKLLPNQYPPPELNAASEAIWQSLNKLLDSKSMAKLQEAQEAFDSIRSEEPRYETWPSAASSSEQIASFNKFIEFHLEDRLAPFAMDKPFQEVEAFVNSLKSSRLLRHQEEDGLEALDLLDLCRTKLFVSLVEGKRTKALRQLSTMFKLAHSQLFPGASSEEARAEAAGSAIAMLKTPGWQESELKALQAIVRREAESPFPCVRIVDQARIDTLKNFERRRLEAGSYPDEKEDMRSIKFYWGQYGAKGLFYWAEDVFENASYGMDADEALELDFLDALEQNGPLAKCEREDFINSLKRKVGLSESEEEALDGYCVPRSEADALLAALDLAIAKSLGAEPPSPRRNPLTGEASFSCQSVEGGFQVEILPGESWLAFAPAKAAKVEITAPKM